LGFPQEVWHDPIGKTTGLAPGGAETRRHPRDGLPGEIDWHVLGYQARQDSAAAAPCKGVMPYAVSHGRPSLVTGSDTGRENVCFESPMATHASWIRYGDGYFVGGAGTGKVDLKRNHSSRNIWDYHVELIHAYKLWG